MFVKYHNRTPGVRVFSAQYQRAGRSLQTHRPWLLEGTVLDEVVVYLWEMGFETETRRILARWDPCQERASCVIPSGILYVTSDTEPDRDNNDHNNNTCSIEPVGSLK